MTKSPIERFNRDTQLRNDLFYIAYFTEKVNTRLSL